MPKVAKVKVEVDLLSQPEVQEYLREYKEFVEAVRHMRRAQKRHGKTYSEWDLTSMRIAERKVDSLLRKRTKGK